jgi:hypothetical protein
MNFLMRVLEAINLMSDAGASGVGSLIQQAGDGGGDGGAGDGGDGGGSDGGDGGAGAGDGGGDGGTTGEFKTWTEQLFPETRTNEVLRGKELNDVITEYIEDRPRLAAIEGRTFVPGESATPEEIAAYRTAIGVPENAAAYNLEPLQGENGETLTNELAATAHAHNVSPEGAKAIRDTIASAATKALEAKLATDTAAGETAKTEALTRWGNDAEANAKLLGAAVTFLGVEIGDDPVKAFLSPDGGGNKAEVIDRLVKLGKLVTEAGLVGAAGGGGKPAKRADVFDYPSMQE